MKNKETFETDEEIIVGQQDDLVAGEQVEEENLSTQEDLNLKLQIEKENSIALTKMLQQLQADFSNYRKRNANLANEARQNGIYEAVKTLLPALDAINSAKKAITDADTLAGLEMVEREFLNNLATLEITPIESVGAEFNPQFHNAIVAEEVEGIESGQVLEEFKQGFKSPSGVVREAMVKVSK